MFTREELVKIQADKVKSNKSLVKKTIINIYDSDSESSDLPCSVHWYLYSDM